MKKFVLYLLLSLSWLAFCMVLFGFGIFVPDYVFYPGLVFVLLVTGLIFSAEG